MAFPAFPFHPDPIWPTVFTSLISTLYFCSSDCPDSWPFLLCPGIFQSIHHSAASYLSKTQGSAVFYLWRLAFTHSIKPQILSLVFKGFILCLLPVFLGYLSMYHIHTLYPSQTGSTDHFQKMPYTLLSPGLRSRCSLCLECTLFYYLPVGGWHLFKTRPQEVSFIPTLPALPTWITVSLTTTVRISWVLSNRKANLSWLKCIGSCCFKL